MQKQTHGRNAESATQVTSKNARKILLPLLPASDCTANWLSSRKSELQIIMIPPESDIQACFFRHDCLVLLPRRQNFLKIT